MLVADGGGGYGGTDWYSHDVKSMWQAIADQDTNPHEEVLLGWRRTSELIGTHLSSVTLYRDNLAAAWPPEKSPASAAYLARLDQLIGHLKETQAAAAANYSTFSSVTSTLSTARVKLQPLYQQYVANEASIAKWQADKDAAAAATPKPTASATPSPSPSPQASPVPTQPPVSAAQQEQLNNQARAIMYDLSSTVISGQAQLQKPKPYNPEHGIEDSGTDHSGGGRSGSSVPPLIPVPESKSAGAGQRAGTRTPSVVDPTTVHPATLPPSNTGHGPALAGVQPLPAPPIVAPSEGGSIVPPSTRAAPGPPPPAYPITGVPGIPGISGIAGTATRTPVQSNMTTVPTPGRTGGSPFSLPQGRGSALPSGGVIGAEPGAGMMGQGPGRPGAAGYGRRANPVGGVIEPSGPRPGGQRAAGSLSASGAPAQHGPMLGHPGRRNGRTRDSSQQRWDPDNPWATEEGVDPVLLPPDDPGPIDPGPAIGNSR